ncbi:hypothetical protein TREES_T100014897 [Tupaia chinensis]|uniref:Uncharacterized protein n=1 Tax=Tupaia chinensis TaxID=246437 RepID=L9KTE5_TUPCH|nr:hypothetical protein TREES_T100014897 [Tupaia chinensis]
MSQLPSWALQDPSVENVVYPQPMAPQGRRPCRPVGSGEAESYHVYNELSVQKETTGFHEQMVSDEDAEDIHIHYASPIHLNHFGTEDSIYVNIQARPKPPPDPFLTVEYASIAGNRPQPSQLTALEGEPRN